MDPPVVSQSSYESTASPLCGVAAPVVAGFSFQVTSSITITALGALFPDSWTSSCEDLFMIPPPNYGVGPLQWNSKWGGVVGLYDGNSGSLLTSTVVGHDGVKRSGDGSAFHYSSMG